MSDYHPLVQVLITFFILGVALALVLYGYVAGQQDTIDRFCKDEVVVLQMQEVCGL